MRSIRIAEGEIKKIVEQRFKVGRASIVSVHSVNSICLFVNDLKVFEILYYAPTNQLMLTHQHLDGKLDVDFRNGGKIPEHEEDNQIEKTPSWLGKKENTVGNEELLQCRHLHTRKAGWQLREKSGTKVSRFYCKDCGKYFSKRTISVSHV
jgi:hypothetical protein